jgi:hypothetical protein
VSNEPDEPRSHDLQGDDDENDGDGGLALPDLSTLAVRRRPASLQCLSDRQLNRMVVMSQAISYAPVPRLH